MLFLKQPLEQQIFLNAPNQYLPTMTISSTLKYSPKYNSVNLEHPKNFFLKANAFKANLMQLTNNKTTIKSLYHYKYKDKNTVYKFRKRHNVYLSLDVAAKMPYSFFFELFAQLQLYSYINRFLKKFYNFKIYKIFFVVSANSIKIYVTNLHIIFAFLSNKHFTNVNQIYKITLNFNYKKSALKHQFLQFLDSLNS